MSSNDTECEWFAEEEIESRAGDMVVRYIEDERRRLVITLTEKEFQVAQYCGILFRHPFDDGFIYFGPWQDVEDAPGITRCLLTKNTEADLRSGTKGVYDHDEYADIQFQLESVERSLKTETEQEEGTQMERTDTP
ncbi:MULTISPECIES: hypothetical protein [Halobacteriales]|uniref:Uncharacterized protein n=2 Tax=Halobacteriales TaxID=2235 RepID=A0A1I0QZJ1_9EURY|nr:hypothetical protein [Natrinema salifodinae]SEW33134.1 hypothetical protein SAMN05216285_4210 [Natrinema salifodinae]